VSPVAGSVQLVEVELPAGAEVSYPSESFALASHQIWVLEGALRFLEGEVEHDLSAGDCLTLGTPAPGTYRNSTDRPCRYLVVLERRRLSLATVMGPGRCHDLGTTLAAL
jgi:quercetin dioxygenase-like cupin family protein